MHELNIKKPYYYQGFFFCALAKELFDKNYLFLSE